MTVKKTVMQDLERLSVGMPKELKEKLFDSCYQHGLNPSIVVRKLIENAIAEGDIRKVIFG